MPVTPYHFGPSGLLGLIFKKWLDIPVFVLANVIVDIEVLIIRIFELGWPVHRYSHTLLIGGAVGIVWGIAAYPLRRFFGKIMRALYIPYQTGFWKMVISGVLGVWLHAAIDAVYHWDVQILWPSRAKPLFGLINQGQVKVVCIACFFAALILYAIISIRHAKQSRKNHRS